MSITAILLIPAIGALVLALTKPSDAKVCRAAAFFVSLAAFALSLPMAFRFDTSIAGLQFVEEREWIPSLGIRYIVGLDGISLFLFLLTAFLSPLAILGAFGCIDRREREFYACMLILESGLLGTFAAADLFLFYVFWEVTLIPMYFVIGIWGGRERIGAAFQFVLYTMAGSVLMLAAIVYLHLRAPRPAFDMRLLADAAASLSRAEARWLFLAFALAFLVKLPLFPFHTWLPLAHVEAPTPGSVLLAGILLKMGGYGMVRLAVPFFPEAAVAFAGILAALSVAGAVYGGLMAMAQGDFKRLIAYSSVSHMGVCMLGIASMNLIGIQGAMFLMLSHGLTAAGLFLLAGMLYERGHTRDMAAYGGLASRMPVFSTVFVLVGLGAIGVPLTSGFVGEFCALQGAFLWDRKAATIAGVSIVLSAVYVLWMIRRIFFGGRSAAAQGHAFRDATARELAAILPIAILILAMGIAPRFFTDRMEPSIKAWIEGIRGRMGVPTGAAAASAPGSRPRGVSACSGGESSPEASTAHGNLPAGAPGGAGPEAAMVARDKSGGSDGRGAAALER